MKQKALILQNAAGEGPGLIDGVLRARGWTQETIHLYRGETIPSDWQSCSLLVVMGGPMNVYEEETYPFLKKETATIANAIKTGQPVLGFCLGAQLMAKANGAYVRRGNKKEIGWYKVRMTEQGRRDRLFESFPEEFIIFQWHGDTFELPEGAIRIASSDNYVNQAIRINEMSYGFQFHFEITRDMILEWLETGREEIEDMGGEIIRKEILQKTPTYIPAMHRYAVSFLNNYLGTIESNLR
ncbi:MAG: type 1 glutamine amidotransferase [Pseudomonadota bacterium]